MITCPRCSSTTKSSPCDVCGGSFDQKGVQTPQAAIAKAETVFQNQAPKNEEQPRQLQGTLSLSGYQFDRHLATGGMGVTWLGHSIHSKQRVVIKTPRWNDNDSQLRFTREAQALSTCQHQHIVRLIDIDMTTNHEPLLVMDYVPGLNLREIFNKRRLSVSEFEEVSYQLAAAIDHCHRRGIIHRDLKPENIMFNGDHITLLDFSLALVDKYKTHVISNDTPNGFILGTPPYSSPEQLREPSLVDASADIYSYGILLDECIHNTNINEFDSLRLKQWMRIIKQCCKYNSLQRPDIKRIIHFCSINTIKINNTIKKVESKPKNHILKYTSLILTVLSIFYTLTLFQSKDKIHLNGSIDPLSTDTLIINHKNWNSIIIKSDDNTKIRLPGSGNWRKEIQLSNYTSNKIPIRISDSDGNWSLTVYKKN